MSSRSDHKSLSRGSRRSGGLGPMITATWEHAINRAPQPRIFVEREYAVPVQRLCAFHCGSQISPNVGA